METENSLDLCFGMETSIFGSHNAKFRTPPCQTRVTYKHSSVVRQDGSVEYHNFPFLSVEMLVDQPNRNLLGDIIFDQELSKVLDVMGVVVGNVRDILYGRQTVVNVEGYECIDESCHVAGA